MRALVSVVVTVATVMHFTFGCCLHAAHFGPAAAYHDCAGREGDVDSCCMECEHEHDHAHEAATEAAADEVLHPGEVAVRAGTTTAGHDCAGCTCRASIEDDSAARWAACTTQFATVVAAVVLPACVGRVERARDRGGSPPPRDTHPLHERLLV